MHRPLPENAHVAFIRTPRYLWPFNSTASAFWPPLGFCSLAAALRERFPGLRVSILDCPAREIGWASLERRLRQRPPQVLCVGEETVSSAEGHRLARLAKAIDPAIIVVAGGVYFSYAIPETLAQGHVDYIVRGEGEATLVELIEALMSGRSDLHGIPGLALRDGRSVHTGPAREPILDLDRLPRPAYDLLKVRAYGRRSRNHPDLATLEHSRGCIDQCSFCILWKHFGRSDNGTVRPCYRTKSPQRTFDEVAWLVRDFGRRTIHFVDPTFNVDPAWTDSFADLLLAARLPVQFTAWMRADGIVRDESLGVLEKLVRAGLIQVYIGIERSDAQELDRLNKHHNDPDIVRRAFRILQSRYPEVFAIGTVIYGLPWESAESLRALREAQYALALDYTFYIPLTPNPGTDIRQQLLADGFRPSDDLRQYNFFTPVLDTRYLTRRQLENFCSNTVLGLTRSKRRSLRAAGRRHHHPRSRRVYRNLLMYGLKIGLRQLARRLLGPLARGPTLYAIKPRWYDR